MRRTWNGTGTAARAAGAVVVAVCIVASALAPTPAAAQSFNWIDSSGGLFNDPANWSPVGGPPDLASEFANFDLNNTYTVTFQTNVNNSAAQISSGTVTFALSGRTYTLSGNGALAGITAGETARLTLINGDVVGAARVGMPAGSTGFLTIGDDAVLNAGVGTVAVGDSGVGTLTLTGGGRLLGTSGVVVGFNSDGNGTLSIAGGGSAIEGPSVTVGFSGTGAATVTNGGSISGVVTVADQVGSIGTMVLSGSGASLNSAASAPAVTLTVGDEGKGEMTLSSGASATVRGVGIGAAAAGNGKMTVTGSSTSLISSSGSFTVGSAGRATLDVAGGATINSVNALIAATAGSTGAATLTGSGTAWNTATLVVGGQISVNGGSGTLTISDDAVVNISGEAQIRTSAGSAVTLDGGTLIVGGTFGRFGTLNHRDGLLHLKGNFTNGTAVSPLVIDGAADDDLPMLRMSGAGGSAFVGAVTVGNTRAGALILEGGRQLFPSQPISIGASGTGSGSVTLSGANTLLNGSTLSVGGTNIAAGGTGVLTINSGARADVVTANVWPQGTVNLNGGTLRMSNFNPGGTFNFSSGTVTFASTANLSAARLDSLLGAGHVLGFGQNLTSDDVITVDAPVTVDGGRITAASGYANNASIALLDGTFITPATLFNNPGRVIRVAGAGALSIAAGITNNGVLQLDDNLLAISGGTLTNGGTIRGSGIIANTLTNNGAGGEIRATLPTDRILFTGSGNTNNGVINASGGGGTVEFDLGLTNNGQINLTDGVFKTATTLTNSATGRVAGRGTLSAVSIINSGQIQMSGGVSDVFGTLFNNNGARVLVTGGGMATFYGNIDNGGGANVSVAANSSAVFLGSVSGAGTISGSGTKYFADGTSSIDALATTTGDTVVELSAHLTAGRIREDELTVHGDVVIAPNGTNAGTSKVNALVMSETGTLDLSDNKLIVVGGDVGTFDGVSYSGLTRHIASAYNFSSWDGPGIRTSQSDAGPTVGLTTLAINTADETFYAGGTFGGVPVASGDVLIMYTYGGDVNLDGLVDAADYGVIDNWIQFPGTSGYMNGDFNYDGVIDAADYGIIDNSIQLQGPPIPTNAASANIGGVTAVPEPAACLVAALIVAPLVARRRRRRSRAA